MIERRGNLFRTICVVSSLTAALLWGSASRAQQGSASSPPKPALGSAKVQTAEDAYRMRRMAEHHVWMNGAGVAILNWFGEVGGYPEYGVYSRKVLNYLYSAAEEVPEIDGYRWPLAPGVPVYETGDHGAYYVGLAFIDSYRLYKDPKALEYAEGLARWLMSIAIEENGGYTWTMNQVSDSKMVGLHGGSAGTATLFAQLYRLTGKEDYKKYALGAGRWVQSQAIRSRGGYAWSEDRVNGDISRCHGTAGMVYTFYFLYLTTGDDTMKEYAEGALRWLEAMAVEDEGGYMWPKQEGGSEPRSGLGRGMAGVADAFLIAHLVNEEPENLDQEMFGYSTLHFWPKGKLKKTDSRYLKYVRGACDWLEAKALRQGNTLTWYLPGDIGYPKINARMCMGVGGMGIFWLKMYDAFGGEKYKQLAIASTRWLEMTRYRVGRAGAWPWTNTPIPGLDMSQRYAHWEDALVLAAVGKRLDVPELVQTAKDTMDTFVAVATEQDDKLMLRSWVTEKHLEQANAKISQGEIAP